MCVCEHQAVIQSPFSNGGSPAAETSGGEARFSYIPPAAVSDATAAGVSAQPAEPTHSYTAGEIDSVHTYAKRNYSKGRNKKFLKTGQSVKSSCKPSATKTVLKLSLQAKNFDFTFNGPLKEKSITKHITHITNMFTVFQPGVFF